MTPDGSASFNPAFDRPATPQQAVLMLEAWGDPLCMTFRASHAKAAAILLADAITDPTRDEAESVIAAELQRAISKFPTWPSDPMHAVAVLGEEFGELTKAVLQQIYEPHKNPPGAVRIEALQTAAMAIRFVRSLDRYEFARSGQHSQQPDASNG